MMNHRVSFSDTTHPLTRIRALTVENRSGKVVWAFTDVTFVVEVADIDSKDDGRAVERLVAARRTLLELVAAPLVGAAPFSESVTRGQCTASCPYLMPAWSARCGIYESETFLRDGR